MEQFKAFELEAGELIFGGELYNTYVGKNGDLYDSDNDRYIFFED